MATLNSSKRNTSGDLGAGYLAFARTLQFDVDFGTDFVMGTATDDINLATLPEGTIVLGGTIQQIVAGTGTGTAVLRVGSTTISGTLASTATAGALAATVPAAIPLVVAAGGAELNLLGATAVRTAGRVRVVLTVVEGDRVPRTATTVDRDTLA